MNNSSNGIDGTQEMKDWENKGREKDEGKTRSRKKEKKLIKSKGLFGWDEYSRALLLQ